MCRFVVCFLLLSHNQMMKQEALQKLQQLQQSLNQDNVSIFCYLCKGYLTFSTTVKCGHVFCSFCLEEYFLFSSKCPLCPTQARYYQTYHNITLDKIVVGYLKKYRPQEYQQHMKTIIFQKQYKRLRLNVEINSGDIIDVRDNRHIWHKARVIRTIMQIETGKVKILRIRHMDSRIEQQISEDSIRIAPNGFFTDRSEIPKNSGGLTTIRNQHQTYLFEQ